MLEVFRIKEEKYYYGDPNVWVFWQCKGNILKITRYKLFAFDGRLEYSVWKNRLEEVCLKLGVIYILFIEREWEDFILFRK